MSYVDPEEINEHLGAHRGAMAAPESEEAVLSVALAYPDRCEEAFDTLKASHFADRVLGKAWGHAASLFAAGRGVTPHFVADAFGQDSGFQKWGGVDRLHDLVETVSLVGFNDHISAVLDRSLRRAGRELIGDVSSRLADTSAGDALDVLGDLERKAGEITASGPSDDQWIDAADLITSAVAKARARDGRLEFPTGLREFDDLLGGFHRGEMTIAGARPGMGKTVLGQTSARAVAMMGMGALVISLEMGAEPMGLRLACDLCYDRAATIYWGQGSSNPTLTKAAKNELSPDQWRAMADASEIVRQWPFKYEVRSGFTMAKIEALCRRQFRAWARAGIKPGIVVIDHLGKVRPSQDRRGNMHAEMADRSRDAAEMAKRLDVPVLALLQLNRAVESREDKRPVLSDLRQAGELEEDARQVVFLHRPEYYLRDAPFGERQDQAIEREAKLAEAKNKLFLIVEKNSHGPTGQAQVFCDIGCSVIRSWEP